MKANELRIGNYVYLYNPKAWPEYVNELCTVIGIDLKITKKEKEIWQNSFGGLVLESKNRKEFNQFSEYAKPIPLTEEWLLDFCFENWGKGKLYSNEFETYDRFVLHNVLDGTSNFEVHLITSNYSGGNLYLQTVCSIDEDERINTQYDLKYVHQLQNLYFALTNEELIIKL